MGDTNKKYMSFWKRHMHRSVSSPSLARKSGKLSKDEISMPFPGDPSCFRPLNSFYGSSESNSNHCRSAEILSDSQGNAKDSILEKNHLGGSQGKVSRDAGGKSRSKSINTLLRSQEIYTSEQHHALQARGLQKLGSAPETPKQKQDNVTNSYVPSVSGESAESTERIDSSSKSVIDSKSCNGSIRPLKENGPDATVEPTRKLPLGSKNREENKKSKLMALGRRSQRQKNINFDTRNTTKGNNDQKTQQEKKKESKPSIFGISFRRKKKENNTKSHVTIYEVPEKESPDNKSSQSASPGENLLPGGKQDELYGYGSPIYEIMTPTEIYERRASIKNINGASTPNISSSQRRTGNNEDRHFDFDLSKINLKISPEAQNSKQSLKKGDANSCIIDTPDGNKIPERSPTVSDSTEDNKSTSITFKSESPEGVKEVVNILPETSTHSQHTWDSPGGLLPPPELKTQPTPPRKHQHITRTRSEPTKGRGDLSVHRTLTHTQSEAMYPLLDDHLKKHNIRVAAELGIDIPSLSKSDVPAIERARNSRKESDPEFSTPTNATKRRPASLTLPEYGDTSEQTSQYSSPLQNKFDPIPRSISQTFNLDTAYSTSKQAPLAAGESFSNNGPVPGGQTHYISTKKQVVVKKIGRTGDPRHANRPASQTTGQMVDSTDGPAPRRKGNVQETGTHTSSDIPAAPPPPPVIVGAIRKKQQEFTKGSDLQGINKVNLYPKEGNPRNSEEVRDALPQYDPPSPPREAKLPLPNETTLSHSKETILPLSNGTTIPLPKETAIPRPREPTLHSHYDDVFEAPTHRMESVIPQRPLYAVGEDLYDIPRYRSHQQPYTQRTLHPSRANAYNVYDNPGRFVPPQPNIPRTQAPSSDRDVAKAAVINWVTDRVAQLPANARAMYVNHQWSCKVQPKLMYRQPPIYEENSDDVYRVYQPRELITAKAKHYNDPYQFVGIYRSASLERIEHPPPPVKSVVYGNAHSQIPHYTVPRRLPYQQRSFHYAPPGPNLIYDQYAAFHRSPSLDRQGRRPHAQSSVNLYARPSDLQYARFLSPQKYSSSQHPSPAGFYRTASLDRLGRRNLAVAGPGDPYLHPPRSSHHHHRHPGYYHQQPPMVLQQKTEHQLRYDQHMNGQQSPYADRRQMDPAGSRFRSYSSAAHVMRPSASPQPPQQNQSHDYQRNYQLPTPI